jgi:hypothetical protein
MPHLLFLFKLMIAAVAFAAAAIILGVAWVTLYLIEYINE